MGKRIELSTNGSVSSAMEKRAKLCHTGEFMGMNGAVKVTRELLEGIAKRYNETHAQVQNENDYAPILCDHERRVDLVKGRIMADLSVEPWMDPETNTEQFGLFGTLRIDDEEAKKKVEAGLYSQLSIGFDEETAELFEVSFVAVEAAKRSQILSRGDGTMNLEAQLAAAKKKSAALKADLKKAALARKAELSAATGTVELARVELGSAEKSLSELALKVKTIGLRGEFKNFLAQGRITKKEFDDLKVGELAALPESAVKAILAAYSARPATTDGVQFGQNGAEPVKLEKMSTEQVRALMAKQLAGEDVADKPELEQQPEQKPEQKPEEKKALGMEDMDEMLKALEGIAPVIEKMKSHFAEAKEKLSKLSDEEQKFADKPEDETEEE